MRAQIIISMWTVGPSQAKILNIKGTYVMILHATDQTIK